MPPKKTVVSTKKTSVSPKKTDMSPKKVDENDEAVVDLDVAPRRKIAQISMRDHVLTRPMWAGSMNIQDIDTYVYNAEDQRFVIESLKYSPVLAKIIDEIVVNASDQHIMYPKLVNKLDITLDDDGTISVYNNGKGFDIEKTKNEKGVEMYSPQLAFTEFLAGSNLNDDEDTERIVGGQNGIGAKLTVVFSKEFVIETTDAGIYYRQVYKDNMTDIGIPEIIRLSSSEGKALSAEKKKSHTRVTFLPDYKRLKIDINKFLPTLRKLVEVRAWYAAAYANVKTTFNGKLIDIKNFKTFCEMFTEYEVYTTTLVNKSAPEKFPWEIGIGLTDGKESYVSLVNGVHVHIGGTHIKHLQNQLVSNLKDRIEKEIKKSGAKFNRNLVTNNLFIFMKGSIPNPDFLGQTKGAINNPLEQFKDYMFTEKDISKIWDVIRERILNVFTKKQLGDAKTRANRSKIRVSKYTEAKLCRDPKKWEQCGLIITEGDSASGTADIGLQSKLTHKFSPNFTYEYFGVFSIQGVPINGLKESTDTLGKKRKTGSSKKPSKVIKSKSKDIDDIKCGEDINDSEDIEDINIEDDDVIDSEINTVDETHSNLEEALTALIETHGHRVPKATLIKNERIEALKLVLGLDYNKTYDFTDQGEKEWKTLRYGFVAGLTDQDLDGLNIFGLLATYFTTYWPNLIRRGFLRRIYTPLLRAYPKKKKKHFVRVFYTEREAQQWIEEYGGEDVVKKDYYFPLKYCKGLGTHNEKLGEVSQMFKNIDDKIRIYTLDNDAIRNMFIYYSENTKLRKRELALPVSETPEPEREIPLSQQFCIDTKMFQRDNILRKLPHFADGLVESRRKVLYTARLLGNREIKVAGMAGEVVAKANYHHGEKSLEDTIKRMAQSDPGARNLPLLRPLGTYGTRKMGYRNAASSRYIYTTINARITDKMFRKEDDFLLKYDLVDGERYEPKYYVPIIPYVLCENVSIPGTGWDVVIYAREINAIFKNIRDMIAGKKCSKLPMWNKDFRGKIVSHKGKEYFVGEYVYDAQTNTINITELPVGLYSDGYIQGAKASQKIAKNKSAAVESKGILSREWVEDIDDDTTEDGVNITVYLKPGAINALQESKYGNETFDCIIDYFGLKKAIHNRINLVNENDEVVEYKSYENVFNDWFRFRKDLYSLRVDREIILNDLEIKMLRNMQRFSTEHDSYGITKKTSEDEANRIIRTHKYDIFNKTLLDNPRYTEISEMIKLITSSEHGASYQYLLNLGYMDLLEQAYEKREERIRILEERQKYLLDDMGLFKGAKIWLKELEELEEAIKFGIATNWCYGENDYMHEDDDVPTNKSTLSKNSATSKTKRSKK